MRFWKVIILAAILAVIGLPAFAQQTATQQLTLNVTAPAPIVISTTTLPNDVINVAYNQSISASGGIGALSFTVSAGTLPTGLTISPAGVVSGTPTVAGTYNFTVQAADTETPPQTKTQAYTVIIIAKLVFTSSTVPQPTLNQPYTATLPFVGGIGPYVCSVSAGTLPTGLTLTLSGLNCVLSGTPTALGSSTFTIQVASAQ